MKRIISLLLSIIISVSTILFCAESIYSVKAEEISINSFVEEGVKLIRENDAEKDFIPETIENQITDDTESKALEHNRATAKPAETESVPNDKKEFSDTAFQTCRLIIKASKAPDKLNSIGMASGFKDWYIVQFDSEKDTQEAYKFYSSDKSVVSVSPDLIKAMVFDEEGEREPIVNDSAVTPTRLYSWGSITTGLYDVKDYIDTHSEYEREITIGVIDNGVDLDNEFVKDRLIRTFFNASTEGEENSEYLKNAHGTRVSSVIVDNTPEKTKIKVYKCGTEMSTSAVCLALLKAISDGVDLINCSFSFRDDNEILKDILDCCFENNIQLIASAGNSNRNILSQNTWPARDERTITVAANEFYGMPAGFTSYGSIVDLMAPGEEMPVSVGSNTYDTSNGTSFSSPMVASLFADLMILFPSYSNKQLEHLIYSNADPSDIYYDCGLFGFGIIDAIGSASFERNIAPSFSLPEGKYIDEIEVEITAEPGCEIYYSLDGSYPSKECGIPYTEPVKISDDCPFLKAVAYGKGLYRSECTKALYRLQRVGTDDMFEISDEGQITLYTGDVYDLIIPETIDGIIVKSIAPEVFSNSGLVGVSFPDTMTTISQKCFYECESLMVADGKNISVIERESFYGCGLYIVDFPNVEKIESQAFAVNIYLSGVIFPKCNELGASVFRACISLRLVLLPLLENSSSGVFKGCMMLTEADLSSFQSIKGNALDGIEYIKVLDLTSIKNLGIYTFDPIGDANYTLLERLELSNVEEIHSVPYGIYKRFQKPLTMVLPSTFTLFSMSSFNNANPHIIVYGTHGTYAEQWANEYENIDFIEISQKTAVINDLPDEFFDYMRYLYADVVGFNRIYQWYGSYSDKNTGGIPIEGANERKFIPKEKEKYPYYYCVVTSTDVGYDPIVIRTGASRYMEYDGEIPQADYSALDEIIATVPEDLSIYTDESVAALNEIINSIDRNLDISDQETVDGYVKAVSNAIAALKLKEHTVSFIVDNESVLSYELEYGSEITNIPLSPEKSGYTFSKWTPDIPLAMPNNSLTFTAEFEPVTYYASFTVDGEEIEKVPFNVETESISEPEIPGKEGYTGKWSEYIIAASDITVNAEYTLNEYTVSFVADDKTVKSETVKYGSKIEIPDVPQKEGYIFKEWLPKIPETMPAKEMTFYAAFEEVKQPDDNPPVVVNPSVDIRNFAYTSTVDYRTTITFTAITKDIPKDSTVVWYIDGQKSGEGEKFTVKEAKEAFTVQAKTVDKSGNVLNGSETELVKVKTDFFSRIVAFFRMLFGKLPVIEQ